MILEIIQINCTQNLYTINKIVKLRREVNHGKDILKKMFCFFSSFYFFINNYFTSVWSKFK